MLVGSSSSDLNSYDIKSTWLISRESYSIRLLVVKEHILGCCYSSYFSPYHCLRSIKLSNIGCSTACSVLISAYTLLLFTCPCFTSRTSHYGRLIGFGPFGFLVLQIPPWPLFYSYFYCSRFAWINHFTSLLKISRLIINLLISRCLN